MAGPGVGAGCCVQETATMTRSAEKEPARNPRRSLDIFASFLRARAQTASWYGPVFIVGVTESHFSLPADENHCRRVPQSTVRPERITFDLRVSYRRSA